MREAHGRLRKFFLLRAASRTFPRKIGASQTHARRSRLSRGAIILISPASRAPGLDLGPERNPHADPVCVHIDRSRRPLDFCFALGCTKRGVAKYIPGPIGSDFRGSIGATTYSHNRGGNFTRARVKPRNPKTAAQIAVRAALKLIGPAWKNTLTDPQRLAWYRYGQQFPTSTTLWPSRPNAGYEAFTQCNVIFGWFGYPLLLDAPLNRDVSQPTALELRFVPGITPQILLTCTLPGPTEYGNVFASPANSPGRLNAWQRHVQYINTISAPSVLPFDLAPSWVLVYGPIPAGKRIGVQLIFWNYINGALSRRLAASVLTS